MEQPVVINEVKLAIVSQLIDFNWEGECLLKPKETVRINFNYFYKDIDALYKVNKDWHAFLKESFNACLTGVCVTCLESYNSLTQGKPQKNQEVLKRQKALLDYYITAILKYAHKKKLPVQDFILKSYGFSNTNPLYGALEHFVAEGNENSMGLLLNQHNIKIEGTRAVHYAVCRMHLSVLEILLKYTNDVNREYFIPEIDFKELRETGFQRRRSPLNIVEYVRSIYPDKEDCIKAIETSLLKAGAIDRNSKTHCCWIKPKNPTFTFDDTLLP